MKKFKIKRERKLQVSDLITTFIADNPHLSVTCKQCGTGFMGLNSSPLLYEFLHAHSMHMLSYRSLEVMGETD